MTADAGLNDTRGASDPYAAFAEAAAADLDLLSNLHDREPTAAVVSAIQGGPLQDQFALLITSDAGQAALQAMTLAAGALPKPPTPADLDNLAAGFADVYLRHTFRTAPTESVWLTEDGLERQTPMFELREWYRKHGLTVSDWANRPDDHLVLQLRFLSHLCAQARTPADFAEVAEFLDAHPLRWIKQFAVRLVQRDAPNWYAALALLTAAYLDELRDLLADMTGRARAQAPAEPQRLKAVDEEVTGPYVPGIAPSW